MVSPTSCLYYFSVETHSVDRAVTLKKLMYSTSGGQRNGRLVCDPKVGCLNSALPDPVLSRFNSHDILKLSFKVSSNNVFPFITNSSKWLILILNCTKFVNASQFITLYQIEFRVLLYC
jgi:hypothetical protein